MSPITSWNLLDRHNLYREALDAVVWLAPTTNKVTTEAAGYVLGLRGRHWTEDHRVESGVVGPSPRLGTFVRVVLTGAARRYRVRYEPDGSPLRPLRPCWATSDPNPSAEGHEHVRVPRVVPEPEPGHAP